MADSSALRVAYEPARPSGVPRPGAVRPGSAASYRPERLPQSLAENVLIVSQMLSRDVERI